MIRLKNQTEDLLLTVTRNCEKVIEKAHTKPQKRFNLSLLNQEQLSLLSNLSTVVLALKR